MTADHTNPMHKSTTDEVSSQPAQPAPDAVTKERDALAASFGKCQSELHALRTDNDTLAVENEKLRRILLRYLSPFDFAGGIATPINQLETLKVLLENEHLHPKA